MYVTRSFYGNPTKAATIHSPVVNEIWLLGVILHFLVLFAAREENFEWDSFCKIQLDHKLNIKPINRPLKVWCTTWQHRKCLWLEGLRMFHSNALNKLFLEYLTLFYTFCSRGGHVIPHFSHIRKIDIGPVFRACSTDTLNVIVQ